MQQRSKIVKQCFRMIAALAISLAVPAVKADDWNHKTNITISHPIDVQGTVLAPGSYVVKLLDSTVDRRVVQIFNADGKHLIATVMANSAYRLEVSGADFNFYEPAAGGTPSLRTWLYAGENVGLQFKEVPVQSGSQHANATTSNTGGE
jgi:hypothetical protein